MVSTFVPGSGSLKSTNLPAAFLEISLLLSNAEKGAPAATQQDNVQIGYNLETNIATIEASLPIETALDPATGMVTIDATDYIAASGGTATYSDAGSELFGSELPSAFWQLAQKLHAAELAVPEATRPNNMEIAVNFETGRAGITASLPITTVANSSGQVVVASVDYL